MKQKILLIMLGLSVLFGSIDAQISAKLMRYMDVSKSQICFVYGGDIWVMSKEGGTAIQITNSPGEESWPKFSPDGKSIAFTASYHGNPDIYVMPVSGGVPVRVTYQSFPDRMVEWHPNGKEILFASTRENGVGRLNQLYLVSKTGGLPEKLKIPYGELASFSPDGSKLAYITKITENYPFKRYRGGLTSDIILFDRKKITTKRLTKSHAIDGKPAWHGKYIYFLSDKARNMRLNIWRYDTEKNKREQITNFNDFDISYLSAGPDDLVFELGGKLYLLNPDNLKHRKIDVKIISDLSVEMSRRVSVGRQIRNMTLSPDGKRIVFEARGELFNLPVKEGYTINMTRLSGAFDREPAWSPDGKYIAYWSDKSGENQIYLKNTGNKKKTKQLTNRKIGYGYKLYWSPDSQKIAFIDEKNDISIINIKTKKTIIAGNTQWNTGHGGRSRYPISWSSDSKWISFTEGLNNGNNAIYLYQLTSAKKHQVTSGFYNDSNPVFSEDGQYLFFTTVRTFNVAYSDMGDGTWIYPNATRIAAIGLTNKAKYLLHARNDAYQAKKAPLKKDKSKKKSKDKKKPVNKDVKIDLNNMESRLVILPPKAGNIGQLISIKGKLLFMRASNTGSAKRFRSLSCYDLKKRKEQEIITNINAVAVSSNGKHILVGSRGRYGMIKVAPKQRITKGIPTTDMVMNLIPRAEWTQIFNDTWRRFRDFFYDPNMQGVDWKLMKKRYGSLLKDVRTRWDLSNICKNMLAELSAGHTYVRGGDVQRVPIVGTGFLGINWVKKSNLYNIAKIIHPATWDTEVRSPFDRSGVDVGEGDTIHSINGIRLNSYMDPYAAFEGFSGKTVTLQISKTGKIEESKEYIIKCLTLREENRLRKLAWIEKNRLLVDKLSGGKLGYIYMSNTANRGQLELVKMYYGQLQKKGYILDERFNAGGQLADRFLELLQRPVVYNLHWRHGKDHNYPIKANKGPVGMLINGWAGSGGDGLPWAFQELKAGPIVGERTLGILVGPATGHRLIDGGGITVPGARLYDNDGHWFWEGEGVKPDFEVWDDPNMLMKNRDPQMEKVVAEVMKLLKKNPPERTPAPALEDRTAKGLRSKK